MIENSQYICQIKKYVFDTLILSILQHMIKVMMSRGGRTDVSAEMYSVGWGVAEHTSHIDCNPGYIPDVFGISVHPSLCVLCRIRVESLRKRFPFLHFRPHDRLCTQSHGEREGGEMTVLLIEQSPACRVPTTSAFALAHDYQPSQLDIFMYKL